MSDATWNGRRNSCSHSLLGPLVLIALGVVFLLTEFHVVSDVRAWQFFWPFLFIAFGVRVLADRRRPVFGIVLIGIGAVLAGNPLGYWDIDVGRLWPLILIVVGLSMLFNRSRHVGWGAASSTVQPGPIAGGPVVGTAGGPAGGPGTRVDGTAVLGGFQRRITDQNFVGGKLTAMFGGFQLDLQRADIAGDVAMLSVDAIFGGGEIRVPFHWIIDMQGQGIFGAFSDETRQEIPAADAKRLVLRGTAAFGGVVVKN